MGAAPDFADLMASFRNTPEYLSPLTAMTFIPGPEGLPLPRPVGDPAGFVARVDREADRAHQVHALPDFFTRLEDVRRLVGEGEFPASSRDAAERGGRIGRVEALAEERGPVERLHPAERRDDIVERVGGDLAAAVVRAVEQI